MSTKVSFVSLTSEICLNVLFVKSVEVEIVQPNRPANTTNINHTIINICKATFKYI